MDQCILSPGWGKTVRVCALENISVLDLTGKMKERDWVRWGWSNCRSWLWKWQWWADEPRRAVKTSALISSQAKPGVSNLAARV